MRKILIVITTILMATTAARAQDPLMEVKVLLNAENYTSAIPLIEGAVAEGNIEAQFMLAEIYFYGLGTTRDYVQAKYWYSAAANMNHRVSAERMGDLYVSGEVWEKDHAQAIHFYQIASRQGSTRARERLAEIDPDIVSMGEMPNTDQ